MNEETYREHLTDLQLEVEELRAKLKEAQTGDTISRQAAIAALVDENIIDHMDTVYDYEFRRCKRAIVRILAQLPSAQPEQPKSCNECENFNKTMRLIYSAQPEQRWIPCSERLPKVDESVLVTTEWNDISIAWRIGIDKWFIHEGNTNATTDDLVAWIPLPEPYKERRTDESNVPDK